MRNIIITGAAGNLGKHVSKSMKNEGYNIIATIGPGADPSRIDPDIAAAYAVDLTDEMKTNAFIEDVYKEYGNIDAGIMIAGGFGMGGLKETDGEALRKMYSLNFETAYFIARQLFLKMEEQGGGRLIFIGARPAFTPPEAKIMMAYAMSKSLLFRLAEIMNEEGKDKNIIATVIVPGTIDTSANRKSMPDADFSKWVKPEALADSIRFVLSDTGNNLRETVLKVYNES